MATKLDDASKGKLDDRLFELRRLTADGVRDLDETLERIQELIENKVPPNMVPDWYLPPEIQVDRLKHMLKGWAVTIPEPPVFRPRTRTEVLMLRFQLSRARHVGSLRRTIDKCWDAIEAGGSSLYVQDDYIDRLRFTPDANDEEGITWVGFDPMANTGFTEDQAAKRLWDTEKLAGIETIMALALFPRLAAQIGGVFPSLYMTGLVVKSNGIGSGSTPLVTGNPTKSNGNGLNLIEHWANSAQPDIARPVVRLRSLGARS